MPIVHRMVLDFLNQKNSIYNSFIDTYMICESHLSYTGCSKVMNYLDEIYIVFRSKQLCRHKDMLFFLQNCTFKKLLIFIKF